MDDEEEDGGGGGAAGGRTGSRGGGEGSESREEEEDEAEDDDEDEPPGKRPRRRLDALPPAADGGAGRQEVRGGGGSAAGSAGRCRGDAAATAESEAQGAAEDAAAAASEAEAAAAAALGCFRCLVSWRGASRPSKRRREDLASYLGGLGFRTGSCRPGNSGSEFAVSVYRDSLLAGAADAVGGAAPGGGGGGRRSSGGRGNGSAVLGSHGHRRRAEEEEEGNGDQDESDGNDDDDHRLAWAALLGCHPLQRSIEALYEREFRDAWCSYLLADLLVGAPAPSSSPLAARGSSGGAPAADAASRPPAQREEAEASPPGDGASSLSLRDLRARCLQSLEQCCDSLVQRGEDSPPGTAEDPLSVYLGGGPGGGEAAAWERLARRRVPSCTHRQLHAERERIRAANVSLPNALLQAWQWWRQAPSPSRGEAGARLVRVEYRDSPSPKFQRFRLHLAAASRPADPNARLPAAPIPLLLPCLGRVVSDGLAETCRFLVDEFWDRVRAECHYHAPAGLRRALSPPLHRFFQSGLARSPSPSSPLSSSSSTQQQRESALCLLAGFRPRYPLSAYLHGPAGTGKSSFVRAFSRALEGVLRRHADPSLGAVHVVKQLLNKPLPDLELDLELRRNNNDMSLSGLLAGRRDRSGAVVLALEEVPPPSRRHHPDGGPAARGPDQQSALRVLAERLSGRTGARALESHVRSNGAVRSGAGSDPSVVALLTSNYGLADESRAMLHSVELFENLTVVPMAAVEGQDRLEFATSYLRRCADRQVGIRLGVVQRRDHPETSLTRLPLERRPTATTLDLREFDTGTGDARPLVRLLRMVAYYAAAHLCERPRAKNGASVRADGAWQTANLRIVQRHDGECSIQDAANQTILVLRKGSVSNFLVPADGFASSFFSPRTSRVLEALRRDVCQRDLPFVELATLIEFWWTGTLAPAVILSQDKRTIQSLLTTLSTIDGVHALPGIDASSYRMMKSLYEPFDTPNLRDDIRRLGAGADVVVELRCRDRGSQLCIREMIEDTPSMTAYSTDRSALHKEGLLFLVHVGCDVITPQLRSRASLVL